MGSTPPKSVDSLSIVPETVHLIERSGVYCVWWSIAVASTAQSIFVLLHQVLIGVAAGSNINCAPGWLYALAGSFKYHLCSELEGPTADSTF